jgi:hypothetical protein
VGLAVMLFKKFSSKSGSSVPQLAAHESSPASEETEEDEHDHDFDD